MSKLPDAFQAPQQEQVGEKPKFVFKAPLKIFDNVTGKIEGVLRRNFTQTEDNFIIAETDQCEKERTPPKWIGIGYLMKRTGNQVRERYKVLKKSEPNPWYVNQMLSFTQDYVGLGYNHRELMEKYSDKSFYHIDKMIRFLKKKYRDAQWDYERITTEMENHVKRLKRGDQSEISQIYAAYDSFK